MKGLKIISWLVIVVMTIYGLRILVQDSLGHGAGFDIFLAGTASPWQAFINQDLVSGLLIALAWMLYRQHGARAIDSFAWTWMVLWWGNIVVAVYVLVALRQAGGDTGRLFTGSRAGPLRTVWPQPGVAVKALLLLGALASAGYMVLLVRQAADGIAIAGAVLGIAPVALSLVLLAFPAPASPSVAVH